MYKEIYNNWTFHSINQTIIIEAEERIKNKNVRYKILIWYVGYMFDRHYVWEY